MQAEPLTVEDVIQGAIAQADRLVEDAIRASVTRMLTVGGEDAEPDLDAVDDIIAGLRLMWREEREKIPAIITRALADRAAAGPRS